MLAFPHQILVLLGLLASLSLAADSHLTKSEHPRSIQYTMAGTLVAAQWFHTSGNISHIFLQNTQGNCTIVYSARSLKQITTSAPFRHTVNRLTILFYDPIYANKGMIHVDLNLEGFFNDEKNMWVGVSTANVTSFDNGSRIQEDIFPIQFVISKSQSSIILNGVELKITKAASKGYDWVPCIILISELAVIVFMQFSSVIKLASVSTLSVVLTMVNQLSLSFVYIYLSFVISSPQYSIVLLFTGAFTMTCFLKVLQKYHKIIQLHNKWQKMICILLISYIYCHLLFFSAEIFNILNSLVLLSQIFKNARSNSKRISSNNHLILLFLLNNIFPIYLHFSSNNIFRISPNQQIGVFIFALVILQVVAVKIQYYARKWGCVKRLLCSAKEVQDAVVVCSICLCETSQDELVTTPCQHQFHQKCLIKWLKYKRICPMDRKKLSLNDIC